MKIGKIRINMIKSDAYVDAANAFANVGESIQAVAVEQIYARLGVKAEDIVKVDQCNVKEYDGEPIIFPIRLPLSKNTMDEFFPLPASITPVFMSLHAHDDIFDGRPDMVEYFKNYEPIGCRDEKTCQIFRKHSIESYMMGCYTLCIAQECDENNTEEKVPFLVDVSDELYEVIPEDMKRRGVVVSHAVPFNCYPITHEEDERLVEVAREYLRRYKAKAEIIITSRLHAAAPGMAMGIPVVLASNNVDFRYAWVDKYLELYQEEDYASIDWKPQVKDIGYARNLMLAFFKYAIENGKPDRETLIKLDAFYRDRNKTEYYKCFRSRLKKLYSKYDINDKFTYAIWGAGAHALFAKELMDEMFPNAELIVVVDKFKAGELFGKPIVCGDKLNDFNVDHVCITTNPGCAEAKEMCGRIWDNPEEHFTVITSQQKS